MTSPLTANTGVPQVSIVIPVYRNAPTLRKLHAGLGRVLDMQKLSYELVFVNDACPEDSLSVLVDLAECDPHTAVLALERNVGQQRAVMAGLSHARGNWIVVMDADLQDSPDAIGDLLIKLEEGYAAVFAGRQGAYEPFWRLLSSRLFKRLLSWLSGVPANAGIFVAVNREMVDRLLAFDAPHPFLVAMIGCTGLPLTAIQVQRAVRPTGRSAYSAWKRLKIGALAIGWTLIWKWRCEGRGSIRRASTAPIQAYYGARFNSAQESKGTHAPV